MPTLDPDALAKKLGRADLVGLGKNPKVALAEARDILTEIASAKWYRARNELCWVVFLGLVRSKTPIDPTLRVLLPVPTHADHRKASDECLAAIADADRLPAMIHALGARTQLGGGIVVGGLLWLERYPDPALAAKVLEVSKTSELMPPSKVRPVIAKLAQKHPALAGGLAKGPPPLSLGKARAPKSPKDLSPMETKQLLAAAKAHDGKKATIGQRFGPDDGTETSLGKTIELATITAGGKPKYDVFQFAGDAGSVFAHGTTREVASIVQGGIECEDADLFVALSAVLPSTRRPARKPAAKKSTAKKSAAAKTRS